MENRNLSFSKEFSSYEGCRLPGVILPTIKPEAKYYEDLGLEESVSNKEFLRALALDGAKRLKISSLPNKQEYYDRIKEELATFDELGFTDYILLNWDVLNFCHKEGIPVGEGRGSAGGSMVLCLIGVTDIDSVKHKLYFSRFVSKNRARKIEVDGVTYLDGSLLCDIDNDISFEQRHRVIEYIEQKHRGKTCKILTLNTLSGKLCVKECGKIVAELSEDQVNEVSGFIPKTHGVVMALSKAYEESEDFKKWADDHEKAYKIARKLEGLNKNTGIHPSGIAICHERVEEIFPTHANEDGSLVSSIDMNWVAEFSVKFDILGLRSLSVVQRTCDMLGIKRSDIDTEDYDTIFKHLDDLRSPHGLFQIEADTNYRVCRKVKPRTLDHLSAVLAIARPGALDFLDDYAKYIETGEGQSAHKLFDDVLGATGGIPLFQEQLLQMAMKIGFSADDAEMLRRIVGKKKLEEIPKWKKKIENKIEENELPKDAGNVLWKVAEDSASYSFNASHSLAYASLSAQTIYLKFNHPHEFFISLLEMTKSEPDPLSEIRVISQELNQFGIKLLGPDLANSEMGFTKDGDNIRFGLEGIKGVSEKSLRALIDFREKDKPTKYDIFLAAKQAGLNIGTLSALIQAGALPGHKKSRSTLVLEAQTFNILTDREKRNVVALGVKFDYDVLKTIKTAVDDQMLGDDGKALIKPSRFETIKKKYEPYKKIWEKNNKTEKFANWYYENELLGYSYSCDLKDTMGDGAKFSDSDEIRKMRQWQKCRFIGRVEDAPRKATAASGNDYIKMDARDAKGAMNVMLMNNKRRNYLDEYLEIGNPVPEKGNIITVFGSKGEDIIFAEEMSILSNKIYMKLKDLKNDTEDLSV